MEADTIGNRDYIAIVVSKDELDYKDLNQRSAGAAGRLMPEKVNDALQSILNPFSKIYQYQ